MEIQSSVNVLHSQYMMFIYGLHYHNWLSKHLILPSQTINKLSFGINIQIHNTGNKTKKEKKSLFLENLFKTVSQQGLSSVDGGICLDKIKTEL